MRVIFTKNNLPFSAFLRWGLNEPVSHMAIVFDEKIVFHSNFKGVHIEWFETFKKHNEIVFSVDIDLYLDEEENIYQNIITNSDGKAYDFSGLLYLMYRRILNKVFNTPLPCNNKWASDNKFFCIEILELFKQINIDTNIEVSTPYEVYKVLSEKYGR